MVSGWHLASCGTYWRFLSAHELRRKTSPGLSASARWDQDDVVARLLVLGGSWFLGRAVADAALARGWEVATFRRGQSGEDASGVTVVRGDRTSVSDVARLADAGRWDAVVDTSGPVLDCPPDAGPDFGYDGDPGPSVYGTDQAGPISPGCHHNGQ